MNKKGNYGVAKSYDFNLFAPDGVSYIVGAVFAVGDVTRSSNGVTAGNTTNLPVAVGNGYTILLTAAEHRTGRMRIAISDLTAIKIWLDTSLEIDVEANDNELEWRTDTTATDPGVFRIKGDNATIANITNLYISQLALSNYNLSTNILNLESGDTLSIQQAGNGLTFMDFTVNGTIVDNTTWMIIPVNFVEGVGAISLNDTLHITFVYAGVVTRLNDLQGSGFVQANDSNKAIRDRGDAAWTAPTVIQNRQEMDINSTQLQAILQEFPANFANTVISPLGRVDSFVQGFLDTNLAESTIGNLAANFTLFYDNANALTTKVLDDIGSGGAGGTSDWTLSERSEIRNALGITGTATALGRAPLLALQSTIIAPDNAGIAAIEAELANSLDGLTALKTAIDANKVVLDSNAILNLAIKAKTDQLTFTKINELDTNERSINGTTIIGNGSTLPFNV